MADTETRFMAMVRDNEARLRRICRIYAYDREVQRDLYQDILVQLWRGLPDFEGRSSPATWLYRVALNTALARRRSHRSKPVSVSDEVLEQRADPGSRPAQVAEADQRLARLYRAIDRLSDADKTLALLYLEDLSPREIAGIVGTTENNVGVRLHRLRKRLAELV